jgi:hypothetical protein
MARKTKKTKKNRLSVKYAEAHRVRSLLLSEHVHKLGRRDVQTLLNILNDVYPTHKRKSRLLWQPLLVGVGIGLIIVIGMTLTF